MLSRRRYLDDLLDFAERRIRNSEGNPVTGENLTTVFHQNFTELTDRENQAIAEQPVHQVRLAVEVLRSFLGDEENPAEAEYRETALNSLLAHWSLSAEDIRKAAKARDRNEEEEAAEIMESLADRLGVSSEKIKELPETTEDFTEERLEELFGYPSTRRDPLTPADERPRLLQWQLEHLPEFREEADDGEENDNRSLQRQAEQTLENRLQSAVDIAEAEALPQLRDILMTAVGAQHGFGDNDQPDPTEMINTLTRRLAIDFGNSGQVRTTRLRQAAETLQTVLFGLRTGWYSKQQQLGIFSDTHPVTGWKISFDDHYKRADFDEDWHWLARYETWRSAFQSLLHPDAVLHPTLLEESSPRHQPSRAFRTLIGHLRTATRLTPRQARQLANKGPESGDGSGYLSQLRDQAGSNLPDILRDDSFMITEQLSEDDLQNRKSQTEDHFQRIKDDHNGKIRNWLHEAPDWLKEVYFFVPLLLALHLQRSGHFLSALAWYRTIYAYNWEDQKRKIFHGLTLEEDFSLIVLREPGTWLRGWLNPHDIASERGYAYTRFTLQSIISCFLDFADAEFTGASSSSLARARSLYLTALDLLDLPEMLPPEDERAIGNPHTGSGPLPENPAVTSLREHARLSLEKLRSGRNIAGMEQPLQEDRAAKSAAAPFHRSVDARPTIYRYHVLIERAQQLSGIAQQLEASFLSSAERADAEAYNLLQARQDLALSEEQVELQDLRVNEAGTGIELAQLQQARAGAQVNSYQGMLDVGLNEYEREMIQSYQTAGSARNRAAELSSYGATLSTLISSAGSFLTAENPAGKLAALGPLVSSGFEFRASRKERQAIDASTSAQIASVKAGFEQRRQEWRHQEGLARKDVKIGGQQIKLARQQQNIALQERNIALLQTDHAAVTLDFLANKFTNAELYEWMSGVLNRVYRFFLQQATAIALLAQNQLAFERQEKLPGFIQQDYWRPPEESETDTGSGSGEPDRRGLTGSARLLQDIYKLDQFAFKTRERKLELSQTFSLARLFPYEFEQFRQSGRLTFLTTMEQFDRGFPGHYLRLINRISVSVLALVSPSDGIRATLVNSGISRVVVGPDVFRTIEVHRSPELISFTSPIDATGLFELKPEGELLLPFEGQGVETTWQLELPRAANSFDFRAVADILFTIHYTAQYSSSYRRQVISHMDRTTEAERPFHFRQEFADQWYDLHNPDLSDDSINVRFRTRRSDFPPNIGELRIEHLLLCFAPVDGEAFELPVNALTFTGADGGTVETGKTGTSDGVISTRRANGSGWAEFRGRPPIGEWQLSLPNTGEVRDRFKEDQIDDILFVITYKGKTPEWPV